MQAHLLLNLILLIIFGNVHRLCSLYYADFSTLLSLHPLLV